MKSTTGRNHPGAERADTVARVVYLQKYPAMGEPAKNIPPRLNVYDGVRATAAAARCSRLVLSGTSSGIDEGDMRGDLAGHHRIPPGSQFLHRPAVARIKERGGVMTDQF